MTRQERILYHQIAPAKYLADLAAAVGALIAFGRGMLWTGLAIAIIVPIAASVTVMRYADLERLKRSAFGAYVRKFMTPSAQVQRLAGFLMMSYAAWTRSYLLGVLGAALIIHAWTQGLLIPRALRK